MGGWFSQPVVTTSAPKMSEMETPTTPTIAAQSSLEEILYQSTEPEIISPKGVLVFDSGKDKFFDKIIVNLDVTVPKNNQNSQVLIIGYNKDNESRNTKTFANKPSDIMEFKNNTITLVSSRVSISFKVGENDEPMVINNMTVKGIPSGNPGISKFGAGGGNGMLILLLLLLVAAVVYYLYTQGKIKIPTFEQRMASFGKAIKSLSRRH
jgi:hypothetical protein